MWTKEPVAIKYLTLAMWTSPDGITYVPERGRIHAFDGKRWKTALQDEDVDFYAVVSAAATVWATGLRTADGHTAIVGRDFYRLDGSRLVKVRTFPRDDAQSQVVSPAVTMGDVTLVRELDRVFVAERGEWRVVTK